MDEPQKELVNEEELSKFVTEQLKKCKKGRLRIAGVFKYLLLRGKTMGKGRQDIKPIV